MNRPFDWFAGKVGLAMVKNYIHARGLEDATRRCFLPGERPTVTLPAYSLFEQHEGIRVLDLFTPGTRRHPDDFFNAYEEFADRPLGAVTHPEAVCKNLLEFGRKRKFFGGIRTKRCWWVPAMQLVAMYARASGEKVVLTKDGAICESGRGRMEVTPRGCWSNFRGRIVPARVPAADADFEWLRIPRTLSSQPLARLVMETRAPLHVQWAAHAMVRGVRNKELPLPTVEVLDRPKRKRRQPIEDRKPAHPMDVHGCIELALDILAGEADEVSLGALFHALVPKVVSAVEFRKRVGNPFDRGDRRISRLMASRARWLIESIGDVS